MKSRASLHLATRVPHLHVRGCAKCREGWFRGLRSGLHHTVRVVVVNIYYRGRWRRTEYFHPHCYELAGNPYGVAVQVKRFTRKKAA